MKALAAFLTAQATHVVVASKCLIEEVDVAYGLGEDLVSKLGNILPGEDVHDCNHLGSDPEALLD